MNCKQGDLAVVVRSWAGNEGRIVRCVRLATFGEILTAGFRDVPTWVIDQKMPSRMGFKVHLAEDEKLRPVRDSPGEDETLRWAEVPSKVSA